MSAALVRCGVAMTLAVMMSAATAFANSYADMIADASTSVVSVLTGRYTYEDPVFLDQPMRRYGDENGATRPSGLGSGVIFSANGRRYYIVTNFHVIRDADTVQVQLGDDRNADRIDATVVGVDAETDLAVISIMVPDDIKLRTMPLADARHTRVGDVVFAIGNPFGIGETVTQGIISALGRRDLGINTFENFIQTDAAVNVGNSGGALINADGALVGINSAIFSATGAFSGLAFSIPVDMVKSVVEDIIANGEVIRGWLGVQIGDIPEATLQSLKMDFGVIVARVFNNSPAATGGLAVGDVIYNIDGKDVMSSKEAIERIAARQPNETIAIRLRRQGEDVTMRVKVGKRPDFSNQRR